MLQWEEFRKCATKLDVPTEQYTFSVLLFSDYMNNCLDSLTFKHFHVNYEVLYFHQPEHHDACFFRIVPPGARHMGALSSEWDGFFLTTFQFSIHDRYAPSASTKMSQTVLNDYKNLTQSVDIPDTFGGGWLMDRIRTELERQEDTCFEKLRALFQLLLVELAWALPCQKPRHQQESRNSVSDLRAVFVEYYFYKNYTRPSCSRKQLADHLGVCERQLIRILDQLFHMSFRELLTEYRMEAAESWRTLYGLPADETAVQVGYSSSKSFLKAYRRYHGHAYRYQS